MTWPKLKDVAAFLLQVAEVYDGDPTIEADEDGDRWIDVRLQVDEGGGWTIHTGDSQYDQDHRGYWGCGAIRAGARKLECGQVARDLLDQAKDDHAEQEG